MIMVAVQEVMLCFWSDHMQAFLSNYEEYKSGKKFWNSIKNKVMQKVSIDIHNYTKAIEILKKSKCDKDVIWRLSVFFFLP